MLYFLAKVAFIIGLFSAVTTMEKIIFSSSTQLAAAQRRAGLHRRLASRSLYLISPSAEPNLVLKHSIVRIFVRKKYCVTL